MDTFSLMIIFDGHVIKIKVITMERHFKQIVLNEVEWDIIGWYLKVLLSYSSRRLAFAAQKYVYVICFANSFGTSGTQHYGTIQTLIQIERGFFSPTVTRLSWYTLNDLLHKI